MHARLLGAALALLLVATACANGSEEQGGCALAFVRDETTYYPHQASEPPPQGPALGLVSSVTCDDDQGGAAEPESREAVAIRGVDPSVAFLVPDEGLSTIFAAGPPDGSELPAEVQRLLAATPSP